MSAIRIYIPDITAHDTYRIEDKTHAHKFFHVLRMKAGDTFFAFDGSGNEYACSILVCTESSLVLQRGALTRSEQPPLPHITLGFPLIKEDKIDIMLQKGTELGINQFIPCISRHSIQQMPSAHKIERWRKILIEACRQCGRLTMPFLRNVIHLESLPHTEFMIKLYGCHSAPRISLSCKDVPQTILFLCGPEGDFTQEETTYLDSQGFNPISVSPQILRAETAAVFGAGILRYVYSQSEHEKT